MVAIIMLSGIVLSEAQTNTTMPDEVPLFTLPDINGNTVSLEELRGKVVMINFWATWCPPCIEELPTMAGPEGIVCRPAVRNSRG